MVKETPNAPVAAAGDGAPAGEATAAGAATAQRTARLAGTSFIVDRS
jgi:hypothetical protein